MQGQPRLAVTSSVTDITDNMNPRTELKQCSSSVLLEITVQAVNFFLQLHRVTCPECHKRRTTGLIAFGVATDFLTVVHVAHQLRMLVRHLAANKDLWTVPRKEGRQGKGGR